MENNKGKCSKCGKNFDRSQLLHFFGEFICIKNCYQIYKAKSEEKNLMKRKGLKK